MRRRPTTVLAAILTSAICLTSCSSDNDEKPPASAGSPSADAGSQATEAPQAKVATVTGRLAPDGRDALAAAVGRVVDDWFEKAYLGDFPRSDFSTAFAGFTAGAAARAQRNLDLMSNAAISDRIDHAKATDRTVSLDVLAVRHRPVGVTATVDLAFETTGAVAGPQRVTGTLDLTPDGSGWKVFGFEITRTPAGPATPAAPASSTSATETPESGS
jgi:hypothetical protein